MTARRLLCIPFVALGAVLLTATWTAEARAGMIAGCPGQQLSQPFLPWLDPADYTLVGDGGFEAGASGWRLSDGASVVSGNEPWQVRDAGDSRSLNLPAGARATSPAVCVDLLQPTVRFFARSLGGTLQVDATVTVVGGLKLTVPVGGVVPGGTFAPTLPLPLLVNLMAPLFGGTGSVALTFSAVGGAVQIDDVYIDPFKVN
jgi:hypothetical protein